MEKLFVDAYMWLFGANKTQAKKAYRNSDDDYRKSVIDAFKSNCIKTFYED